jgi:hypothetical protein
MIAFVYEEPCGCTWDHGTWFGCAEHPESCRAVVLPASDSHPAVTCGIPIRAGERYCQDHCHTPIVGSKEAR